MNLLTTQYRTGVVYDFSIVEKAVFYILKKKKSGGYKLKEALPVQINPSEINGFEGTSKTKAHKGLGTDEEEQVHVDDDKQELSVTLQFSLYDEYNIRSMDGMLAVSDRLGGNITLRNEKVTILPKLIEYAAMYKKSNIRVLLKWGDHEYFGLLKRVDYKYSTHSRWGEPLRGEATVTIKKERLVEETLDTDTGETVQEEVKPSQSSKLTLVYGEVKSYALASKVLNTAALVASQAAR